MATSLFWRLHPQELLVLQLLLHSLPVSTTSAQVPVHLPHTAANEPWYLLMITLTAGMDLTLLRWKISPQWTLLESVILP